MRTLPRRAALVLCAFGICTPILHAQAPVESAKYRVLTPEVPALSPAAPVETVAEAPPKYVIGPYDVLSILFWREKDLSADVVVRPDGMISLPLLNDVKAVGLTPVQLRNQIVASARRYLEDPNATVVVKEINSRKVFITGKVEKAGAYPLTTSTTVLQLIAAAGGLNEFADGKRIIVMRKEGGRSVAYHFNYDEVTKQKNLEQNIELQPGDTVIVP